MSKIPYRFIPIPLYFDESGLLDDPKTEKLIRFLFRRIRTEGHFVFIEGREIYLEPFEFIFGRDSVSLKVGITGKACWTRMEQLKESNLISTVDSKKHSKYTVYRWLTENFDEKRGQHEVQQKVQQGNSMTAEKGTARGTQVKSESEQLKELDKEVTCSRDTPDFTRSPLFTINENKSPMPPDDDTLGGEIFQRLRILEEVLSNPRVKNYKLMDGSVVSEKDMERWCGKLLTNIFFVFEWYEQRVKNTREKNKLKGENKILGISYIEQCIQKAWWKEYQDKKFARDEDEKQAKRHARNE